MQKESIVNGKLNVIERLPSSLNGNPRYLVEINGTGYRTKPDTSLGYSITNYEGKSVEAKVKIYRGKWAIESIENN